MQKELINSIINYINCYPLRDSYKDELLNAINDYKNIPHTLLFFGKLFTDERIKIVDTIFKLLFTGLRAIESLEEKSTSNEYKWVAIRQLEKDKRNINQYINTLNDSLSIHSCTNDTISIKRSKIALEVFKSFGKNPQSAIEKLALARFHRRCFESNDEFLSSWSKDIDHETIESSLDMHSAKYDLFKHFPEVASLIEDLDDLEYLGSLSNFFWGYRMTPQMIIKSMAIKLYNYPFWIFWDERDSLNKSSLKKCILDLLNHFSSKSNINFNVSEIENFYVKTYFYASPILAISRKNGKGQYTNLFNPEAYYSSIKDNPEKFRSSQSILQSMFLTN
jgi:hypothetical protein